MARSLGKGPGRRAPEAPATRFVTTALRQRFIEDLRIRKYAVSTIDCYTYHVANFARYFGRSPELLGVEEVRAWQVHVVAEKKVSWSTSNRLRRTLP